MASKQPRREGCAGLRGAAGSAAEERRGEGFVRKSRNSSGWQMKSVHSSKAAPYRQPVEQRQALNEGRDNGGAQS